MSATTTPTAVRPHRIVVRLLDSVLPLDAGILLQVFGRPPCPGTR
ncbi:hypothetical protein ACFC09_34995 [Streptomyces sp. NPDC056161]